MFAYAERLDDGTEYLLTDTIRNHGHEAQQALDKHRTSKDDDLSRYRFVKLTVRWRPADPAAAVQPKTTDFEE